ncbi:hypothetical protein [Providencia rettgeri]|uniref:hypothetical protein n=1 Tax=Providencia rettgeri TaxID=587 RepID=UPI0034E09692
MKIGNIDESELNEIEKYIDSVESYYEYLTDRNSNYNRLLTEVNSYMQNGEIASSQISEIINKFYELKTRKLSPPEFSNKLFNALPKLTSEARELLTESDNRIRQEHFKMVTLESTANNINYTIENVKEHGEYKGYDYVNGFKEYGKLIQEQKDYINSQKDKLKYDALTEYEIIRAKDNIKNAEEAITGYLEWAEMAEPVLNKYGIKTFKADIPISGGLDISTNILELLSTFISGINVLDSETINGIDLNVYPSIDMMIPVQVH